MDLTKIKWIDTLCQRYPILKQLYKYGLVGVCAAGTHYTIVILIVENFGLRPLIANIFGFSVAFNISYFGHRNVTFRGTQQPHVSAFTKLLSVALVNFSINQSVFYVFLKLFDYHYAIALLVTLLIVPIISFVMSKYWVFRC